MQFVLGYVLTVLVETPILLAGLSRPHSWRTRLFAGLWLTACTYPVVNLVLPALMHPSGARFTYLLVAETFAPLAECLLFLAAFGRGQRLSRWEVRRDLIAIVAANLASFAVGVVLAEPLTRLGEWSPV